MRLSTQEQQAVSQAIRKADMTARIYLFGSRVDDAAKGGDIDLLVLSKKIKLIDDIELVGSSLLTNILPFPKFTVINFWL